MCRSKGRAVWQLFELCENRRSRHYHRLYGRQTQSVDIELDS
jgi:hypothetical protein